MTLDSDRLDRIAALLADAQRDRAPIEPISDLIPDLDVAAAYTVQQRNLSRRRATGAQLVGHKIGLTSEPMQQLLGVAEPDFGYLLDDMVHRSGAVLPAEMFCAPRVEPEIAFLLHTPVRGPAVTAADVLAATEAIAPALEIVDSRIVDWRITLPDTIADNASSGAVVLGDWIPLACAPALADIAAVLEINGLRAQTGTGRAVMGDPAEAVAWLANALSAFDTTIEAGQLVMSGSFTSADFVHGGDRVIAHLTGVGAVSVIFT